LQNILSKSQVPLHEVGVDWEWVDDFQELFAPYLESDTAIVVNDVNRAALVIRAAVNRGLKPGKDFGLVSCDATPTFLLAWPDLAHVQYDRYEAGRNAAAMMLCLVDDSECECDSRKIPITWREGRTLPGYIQK
jgi:DNA-binding LacI/PurR family transcriptional regulator